MQPGRFLCVVLLMSSCREPAHPAAPKNFTDRVVRVTQRERPTLSPRKLGPLTVDIGFGAWRLENLERQCNEDPPRCETAILQGVDALRTANERGEPLQKSLRPVLFGEATEKARIENQRGPADQQLLFKHFVGDLFIGYAVDTPLTFEHLSRRDLVRLGLTLDELHARAVQNLAAATKPFEPQRIRPGLPFFSIATNDGDSDAARILLDAQVKVLAGQSATFIVAVPSWSAFIISTSDRPEDLAAFATMVSGIFENDPHPVSRTLLRYDTAQGKFVPLP